MGITDSDFEPVIGLEIHVQLGLGTKIFCSDRNEYGHSPNTLISPISLGHPGTLPRLNKKAIEYAVKLGLALNCDIAEYVTFDRKHYFYPDLPKGFQTTQERNPVCSNGAIPLISRYQLHQIHLRKIHLEEDAGKSVHDQSDKFTMVDYNRAGTPLVEIVTLPEIKSPSEAAEVMNEIRKLVRFIGISDGNMEEGSLRCDANISVRKKGETQLGPKVEIKNINSMKFVEKALEYEIERQIKRLSEGKEIKEETRSYDSFNNTTHSQRTKESVDDYRYFPEPDLPPYYISKGYIEEIKNQIPELPQQLKLRLLEAGLDQNDSEWISSDRNVAEYFSDLGRYSNNLKLAAKWLLIQVKTYLNEHNLVINDFPIPSNKLAELINSVDDEKVSFHIASKVIFEQLVNNPDINLQSLIEEKQKSSREVSSDSIIQAVLSENPDEVKSYQSGKKKLFGFLMGELMKKSKGQMDPKKAKELLSKALSKP